MKKYILFGLIFQSIFHPCDIESKPLIQKLRIGINAWGTHFPALATVVANTTGPILELGCGDYSTPMLHGLCAPTKRRLVSTDTSRSWINLFLDLENEWHSFMYVPVYSDDNKANPKPEMWDAVGGDQHWSIIFVDHKPGERRKDDIARLRNNADIFVVHDTEAEWVYHYEAVLSTFKYRYVYERYHVTTTIVSDSIDVAKFFEM